MHHPTTTMPQLRRRPFWTAARDCDPLMHRSRSGAGELSGGAAQPIQRARACELQRSLNRSTFCAGRGAVQPAPAPQIRDPIDTTSIAFPTHQHSSRRWPNPTVRGTSI